MRRNNQHFGLVRKMLGIIIMCVMTSLPDRPAFAQESPVSNPPFDGAYDDAPTCGYDFEGDDCWGCEGTDSDSKAYPLFTWNEVESVCPSMTIENETEDESAWFCYEPNTWVPVSLSIAPSNIRVDQGRRVYEADPPSCGGPETRHFEFHNYQYAWTADGAEIKEAKTDGEQASFRYLVPRTKNFVIQINATLTAESDMDNCAPAEHHYLKRKITGNVSSLKLLLSNYEPYKGEVVQAFFSPDSFLADGEDVKWSVDGIDDWRDCPDFGSKWQQYGDHDCRLESDLMESSGGPVMMASAPVSMSDGGNGTIIAATTHGCSDDVSFTIKCHSCDDAINTWREKNAEWKEIRDELMVANDDRNAARMKYGATHLWLAGEIALNLVAACGPPQPPVELYGPASAGLALLMEKLANWIIEKQPDPLEEIEKHRDILLAQYEVWMGKEHVYDDLLQKGQLAFDDVKNARDAVHQCMAEKPFAALCGSTIRMNSKLPSPGFMNLQYLLPCEQPTVQPFLPEPQGLSEGTAYCGQYVEGINPVIY